MPQSRPRVCLLVLGYDETAREISHNCSVDGERELQLHRPMQPILNSAQSPCEISLLPSPPHSRMLLERHRSQSPRSCKPSWSISTAANQSVRGNF